MVSELSNVLKRLVSNSTIQILAAYTNNQSAVNIGNNETGYFYTNLPAGLYSDSYKLYLFVQVFDNLGAITAYYISTPVIVQMDMSLLVSSATDMLSGSKGNPLIDRMQSSDLSEASSAIISYAATFNQVAAGLLSNGSSNDSTVNYNSQAFTSS